MDFLIPPAADLIVTFPIGSGNGATDCFQIEILQDDDFEGDHDFIISINDASISPAGTVVDNAGIGQITIHENDGKLLTQIDINCQQSHCLRLAKIPQCSLFMIINFIRRCHTDN